MLHKVKKKKRKTDYCAVELLSPPSGGEGEREGRGEGEREGGEEGDESVVEESVVEALFWEVPPELEGSKVGGETLPVVEEEEEEMEEEEVAREEERVARAAMVEEEVEEVEEEEMTSLAFLMHFWNRQPHPMAAAI